MCFKNLPIEFDDTGRARLREGVVDPYSVAVAAPSGPQTEVRCQPRSRARAGRSASELRMITS